MDSETKLWHQAWEKMQPHELWVPSSEEKGIMLGYRFDSFSLSPKKCGWIAYIL
jgi:hypothetical protein